MSSSRTGVAGVGVPSPCIGVCRIDEARGWCAGCRRTLDEIAAWTLLDDAEKRAVWQALPSRRRGGAAPAAAGGAGAAAPSAITIGLPAADDGADDVTPRGRDPEGPPR